MKKLLLLLLISSPCIAQPKHVKTTKTDISYIKKLYPFSAINEPALCGDTTSDENYRFIWVRSFHHPIMIRLQKHNDIYILQWKEWSGMGGYSWDKVITDKKKTISNSIWNQFLNKLHEANFMHMSTTTDVMGNDGANWILEGKTATTYHVVDRWTPRGSDFYKCCDFLISLTDIKVKDEDKY